MTTVAIILTVGALNVVCFFIGAKVGQTVAKGEKIETPILNPMQIIRERENKREAQKEQEIVDTILRNVESYNGTSQGQKEVPKG